MRDILISRLNPRSNGADVPTARTKRMPRQPGRIICDSLKSLKEDINEMNHLTPSQKADLNEALKKLWLARGCDRMSLE